ncbi:TIM-barrel domain-containing protein [Aridibaculum aurantiacum]|uniref:TIM-barrel domain-containing protein n=1 Tax=Aridibaculum aurantiacum TaxID=2810307 RepID=UPI001A9590C4|nr:TIM-barrel domain-containing protein [Aridibaculum aurantiacum]
MPAITSDGAVILNKPTAKWTITPYAANIIQIVAEPKGYNRNENISDAIILKPSKAAVKVSSIQGADYVVLWDSMRMEAKGDSLIFGQRQAVLIGLNDTGDYKGFRFLLQGDEKIFGAGERALPLDRRGYKFNLYNNPWYGYGMGADNLNYSVPFITSSHLYGVFFDNVSKGYLDIGKTNPQVLEYGAMSGQLTFYIILGNNYADILTSYHKLTGTQPLPPRWALGNFLSRFGYTSEAEVRGIMQQMRSSNIPYDAVIFDLFWFGDSIKGTMGNLDWVNKKAWPNPTKMISDFKKEGTQTILITEPFVVKQSKNFAASRPFHAVDSLRKPYLLKDFYFGEAGLIDIFRRDSRDWFWSKYKAQMNRGVVGWWGDLGEPEKHPTDLYHNLKDLGYKRLFKADEVHNAYGHYWTKMLFDKYAKEYPNMRLFSLNRSGFAGTQRYSIFPWSGDVSRSWDGLRAQLPVMLGMSMSGVPYIHADAGGFAGGEKDGELYVRWLQFAQYTPIFRPHGTELSKVDATAPSFPSEPALWEQPYKTFAKAAVDERYALMPYAYTLAYEQAIKGKPLVSPLYYNFPGDTAAYSVEDQYMWGEHMMVSPVLQKGATSRRLYLPEGKWYDSKSFAAFEGRQWVTDTVWISSIPVYLREGSFIPYLGKQVKNTQDYSTENLMITYLPSAGASSYILFDDDGKSKNSISSKAFELISFNSSGWGESCTFTITSNNGKFAGKPTSRRFNLAIPGLEKLPTHVYVNEKEAQQSKSTTAPTISWDDIMKAAYIEFTFTGQPIEIKVVQ